MSKESQDEKQSTDLGKYSTETHPTLGMTSTMSMKRQIRYLTIQMSLNAQHGIAIAQSVLSDQLDLLREGNPFRLVLNEMIAEQRQQEGSHDLGQPQSTTEGE